MRGSDSEGQVGELWAVDRVFGGFGYVMLQADGVAPETRQTTQRTETFET